MRQNLLAHLQLLFSGLGSEREAEKQEMPVTTQDKGINKSHSRESEESIIFSQESTKCECFFKYSLQVDSSGIRLKISIHFIS